MSFTEWWKLPKPAEVDFHKPEFEDCWNAAQQELLDWLTGGVEVPEPLAWMYADDAERFESNETHATVWSIKVGSPARGETAVQLNTLPQLQEYGAAQRLLGAREEREKLHPFKPARGEA